MNRQAFPKSPRIGGKFHHQKPPSGEKHASTVNLITFSQLEACLRLWGLHRSVVVVLVVVLFVCLFLFVLFFLGGVLFVVVCLLACLLVCLFVCFCFFNLISTGSLNILDFHNPLHGGGQ